MNEEKKDIELGLNLKRVRLELVRQSQQAWNVKDLDLCCNCLWNILTTLEKTSKPYREVMDAFVVSKDSHNKKTADIDALMPRLGHFERQDIKNALTNLANEDITKTLLSSILDVLLRFKLIPEE
jgi:hypothetical protein